MKIIYNEKEETIEIKDRLRTQYRLGNFIMILTIIECIIFPLFILNQNQFEWFGFIWILIGIFMSILLIYQLLRKSAVEKLPISEITSLTEKQFLGRRRFSLKLKNGKSRDLMEMKNTSDIIEMEELFTSIGIRIS